MKCYLFYRGVDLVSAKSNLLACYNALKSSLPVIEQNNLKSYVQFTRVYKKKFKFVFLTESSIVFTICQIVVEKK